MRGTDPAHHLHVTEKGEPGFVGFAYYATSLDDLKRVAKAPGASGVENIDEPGGGKRVRLREPNGYQIEVVHGIEQLPPIAAKRQPLNWGRIRSSGRDELMRLPQGPLAGQADRPRGDGRARRARRRCSGSARRSDSSARTTSTRAARTTSSARSTGSTAATTYVDHHVFFCIRNDRAGLNHLSFEVQDIDDVFMGHEHLRASASTSTCGASGGISSAARSTTTGSDPWGRVHEHWSDTDRLNVKNGSNLLSAEEGLVSQWGERPPQKFIERVCP